MTFNFDTGSDLMWVGGQGCNGCLANTTLYDHSASSDSTLTSTPDSIRYLDGSGVDGNILRDWVWIGDTPTEGVIDSMNILLVDEADDDSSGFDGLVGLSQYASGNSELLVQKLKEYGAID